LRRAVLSIATKKYLARAVLALESFAKHNPGWEPWLLLADEPQGYFKPEELGLGFLGVDEIGLPELPKYKFRYTEPEFSISLKPAGLLHLLEAKGYERAIYIDGDSFSYGPFDEVDRLLDAGKQILITPHILRPSRWKEGEFLIEGALHRSGSYNFGFLGIQKGPQSLAMLHWLADILVYHCIRSAWNSSRDQKWIDMLPSLFDSYAILRHPG